jgi:selenide,water dikinase
MIVFADSVERRLQDVLVDPQTSGGLLIGVSAGEAPALLGALRAAGVHEAVEIGEIVTNPAEKVWVA